MNKTCIINVMNTRYKYKKNAAACISMFFLFFAVSGVYAQSSETSSNSPAEIRKKFANYGKQYIGCPYVLGATGPDSFDCSGFVQTVARESIGYQLPRTVKTIYPYCSYIDDSQREVSDLVFFRTTSSSEPSHVGIFIGRNQFLHAASDGPNTGVIISSLNEAYWKSKYYRSGRFLPSTRPQSRKEIKAAAAGGGSSADGSSSSDGSDSSGSSSASKIPFFDRFIFDASVSVDWNFWTSTNVSLNFRGITAAFTTTYLGKESTPGISAMFRWDRGTGVMQIPLTFTYAVNDYFRVFAGPVFTIGTPHLPGDKDKEIKASVFPGIIGLAFDTPSLNIGPFKACFTQNLYYTIYNKPDGAALDVLDTLSSGLVLSSGIRLSF